MGDVQDATRVGVRGSAHTFCVVYKRNSPHTYVWAKQLAPTRLFFSLPIPLTRVRVGEIDNAHTPRTSGLVAMSLNYSCHVGQLQLPWLLNCSCHLRSSAGCHFWATAAVAMYGLIYYSCHDLKTLEVATY